MPINVKETAFLVYQSYREIANHEMSLVTSLQSLVPTNKAAPSQSAQYLYEDSLMLKELSERVRDLMVYQSSVLPRK